MTKLEEMKEDLAYLVQRVEGGKRGKKVGLKWLNILIDSLYQVERDFAVILAERAQGAAAALQVARAEAARVHHDAVNKALASSRSRVAGKLENLVGGYGYVSIGGVVISERLDGPSFEKTLVKIRQKINEAVTEAFKEFQ